MDDQSQYKKGKEPDDIYKDWFNFHPIFHERPFQNVLDRIDHVFSQRYFSPSFNVNLQENEDKYIIVAELPGVSKNAIQIHSMQNNVTITVQRDEFKSIQNNNKNYYKEEGTYQQIDRTIPLYHPIQENNVTAQYKEGLLTIHLPKQKGKEVTLQDISINEKS